MRYCSILSGAMGAVLLFAGPANAQVQRALGVDVSAWQGNLAQSVWDAFRTASDGDERSFAFLRSSRGGTTGYYDQNNSDNVPATNTLSQRYDDPYFIQNITRATKAGILTGSYHFNRADIIASTLNSNGIANTGADEAAHFLQMASPWMRPGYMLPVLDLEAGASQHSVASLSNWSVEFSNGIYNAVGIRPIIYANSSYVNSEVNSTVAASMPNLWIARPTSGNPLTTEPPPASGLPNVYGVWNPTYPNTPTPAPWKFWQYDTTGGIPGFGGNLDKNAANGGIEFVKDYLVPAIWMNDSSGEWTTLSNWNSGVASVEPVQGRGQVARVGGTWTTGTVPARPAQRLPGEDDTIRGVDGQNDTVVLDRPSANITVTLSSGSHNIRKLYAREALNITGGDLTINYVPSPDSTPISAQFSAAVSLSGGASLSVHTLQVDATRTFTVGGGNLAFNKINLMPGGNPAKILLNGDLNVTPLANATATIANGIGAGTSGRLELGGAAREFNVANGGAEVDLSISVPVTNGGLTKAGAGTLVLSGLNTYAGDTAVEAGALRLTGANLANAADLYLTTGSLLDLTFATGTPDVIDSLFFDGVSQQAGVWGAVGSGAQFTSSLITGTGTLQVTTFAAPLAGDFDGNGTVESADLTAWQNGFGMADGANAANGDGDADGDVDGNDFLVWQRNLGMTQSTAAAAANAAAVPEPGAAALMLVAMGALLARRWGASCSPARNAVAAG